MVKNWLGIVGFVLGIIFFIILFSFTDICNPSTLLLVLPILIIIGILSLVFCIIGLRRKTNKISRILSVIGFVFIIFGFFLSFAFLVMSIYTICDGFPPLGVICFEIELNITKINISDNTITITKEDSVFESIIVKDIRIRVNNETAEIISPEENQRWLNNSETKTYTIDKDIKQGDIIEIGAVIDYEKGEIVCAFNQRTVTE